VFRKGENIDMVEVTTAEAWKSVLELRRRYRAGELSKSEIRKVERIPGWSWKREKGETVWKHIAIVREEYERRAASGKCIGQ
jgi:hypothetical protein